MPSKISTTITQNSSPDYPSASNSSAFKSWPPFLIDLLPSGAGRRAWNRRMQIDKDGPQADWHLLIKGAGHSPGGLRIAEAVLPPPPDHFSNGFPLIDIIEQREDFLEYAARLLTGSRGGSMTLRQDSRVRSQRHLPRRTR